ncbi:MAG TPA: hypothetical protein DCR46_00745 [Cytophagales bacterium]|nr:hypothetical protein [Cytophagales bacterium]
MKLRHIQKKDLAHYLHSAEYKNTPVVPITEQRVRSQSQNPRADDDDVVLIVAEEENGHVLAFIGLLPDYIFFPVKKKIWWISCWWSDTSKGKTLGAPLLLAAFKVSQGCLLADASPTVLPFYLKSKLFHVPKAKLGIKLFFKPLIKNILLRKKPSLKFTSPFLAFLDQLISILYFPFSLTNKFYFSLPSSLKVQEIDVTQWPLPEKHNLFQRDKDVMTWIVAFPWILERTKKQGNRPYPFSSCAKRFRNHFYIVKENEIEIAHLFLTERNGVFKLPYLQIAQDKEIAVCKVLVHLLYQKGASEFTTFHNGLSEAFKKMKLPFVYRHATSYQYVWGKELGKNLNVNQFQDGDGDAIFT